MAFDSQIKIDEEAAVDGLKALMQRLSIQREDWKAKLQELEDVITEKYATPDDGAKLAQTTTKVKHTQALAEIMRLGDAIGHAVSSLAQTVLGYKYKESNKELQLAQKSKEPPRSVPTISFEGAPLLLS